MNSPIKHALFFLFIGLFLFVGCSGRDSTTTPQCPPPTVIPGGTQNVQSFYTVIADEHLQDDHKVAILDALNEWATMTANTFKYSLSFIDMSTEKADTSEAHTIKIYVKDPGPNYLGWTSWDSDNHSAYMFIKPSIDGELFRRVMLHELGHACALDFNGDSHYEGPYQSVMHPNIGDDSTHLCCPELQAFCNAYGCQVDCTNVERTQSTNPSVDGVWKEVFQTKSELK